MAFFQTRLGVGLEQELPTLSDSDRQAAEQLWALLGGLPLALDQAIAFVQETGRGTAWLSTSGSFTKRKGPCCGDVGCRRLIIWTPSR